MNACRTIAIWLSAVLVIVFALIMLLTSGGTRKKCAKISLIVTIVYVAALSVLFLSLSFAEDGIKPILFYPLLALILVLGASGVCLYFRARQGGLSCRGDRDGRGADRHAGLHDGSFFDGRPRHG